MQYLFIYIKLLIITHSLSLSIYIYVYMFIIAYNISNNIHGLIIIDGMIDLQINITQHCSEVKKAVILLISPPLSFFLQHIKQRKTKVFLFHPIDRNYEKKAIDFCQYICNIRYKGIVFRCY